jgi:hypothetical protein
VVSLQAVELQLQLTNAQLHHALEDRLWQCGQLESLVSSQRDRLSGLTERLDAAKATDDLQARELHAVKSTLQAREAELVQLQRSLDRQVRHGSDMETELAACKRALEDERARHAKELIESAEEHNREMDMMRADLSRMSFTEVYFSLFPSDHLRVRHSPFHV